MAAPTGKIGYAVVKCLCVLLAFFSIRILFTSSNDVMVVLTLFMLVDMGDVRERLHRIENRPSLDKNPQGE